MPPKKPAKLPPPDKPSRPKIRRPLTRFSVTREPEPEIISDSDSEVEITTPLCSVPPEIFIEPEPEQEPQPGPSQAPNPKSRSQHSQNSSQSSSDSIVIIEGGPSWRFLPSPSEDSDTTDEEIKVSYTLKKNDKKFRGITWHTHNHPSPRAHVIMNSCTIDGFITFLKLITIYDQLDDVMWYNRHFTNLLQHTVETSRQGHWAESVIRQIIDILRDSPVDANVAMTPEIKGTEALAKYIWMVNFKAPYVTMQLPAENQGPQVDCLGTFRENVMHALRDCCSFTREYDCKCQKKTHEGYEYVFLSNQRDLAFFNKFKTDLFETSHQPPQPCPECRSYLRPYYKNKNRGIIIPDTTWMLKVNLGVDCKDPNRLAPVLHFKTCQFYKTFSIMSRPATPYGPDKFAHQASTFYAFDKAYFYDSVVSHGLLQDCPPPEGFWTESVIYIRLPRPGPDPRPLLPPGVGRVPNFMNIPPPLPKPDTGKGKGKGKRSRPAQDPPSGADQSQAQ